MSQNLYCRLVKSGTSLSDATKFLFDKEGYLDNGKFILSSNDLPFLKGIRAASKNNDVLIDVSNLIDLINNNEQIEIFLY